MASSSSAESACKCHIRSVSLPSRSHPTARLIDDVLHRLKHPNTEKTSSFESISSGLARLEDLYLCVTDLLDMASTQQILRRQVGYTTALLDSSVLLLDVCGIARDLISLVKECVQLLQLTLRRRKGDPSMKAGIHDYMNFRNKARKDAKRLNSALNQIKNRATVPSEPDQDPESSTVTRVLIEVNEISTSVFQSVLHPFTSQVSGIKQSRWSSISKLMRKGEITCEEKRGSLDELACIDAAIHFLSKCGSEDSEATKIQLQDAENGINGLEIALESMFRQLIRSRASLLNITSPQ
ncbi:hypothetical protein MLD38_030812 [Melastoma candidum]|uniref:Uncharacterized protein n=1 Tax=Melastoma candidum TaxID=119954 RepID=A0ACB9MMU4_9MYRT|nr:hypothetical protein MLD38_030812 [Melastoma candidum]